MLFANRNPAMENLSTLLGNYGDEATSFFQILNTGDLSISLTKLLKPGISNAASLQYAKGFA
jgi:hypothetical protein